MNQQPDLASLDAQRVFEKFRDLAAIGWVIESLERRAQPIPDYDEIHRLANEWKAKP